MSDKYIEELWEELHEIEFAGSGQLPYDWKNFAKGTDITEIENWFASTHSKGIAGLKYLEYKVN